MRTRKTKTTEVDSDAGMAGDCVPSCRSSEQFHCPAVERLFVKHSLVFQVKAHPMEVDTLSSDSQLESLEAALAASSQLVFDDSSVLESSYHGSERLPPGFESPLPELSDWSLPES